MSLATLPFHADVIDVRPLLRAIPAPAIPANLKAPVDLLSLIQQHGDARAAEAGSNERDATFADYGDHRSDVLLPKVTDEVERLQGCEYDRDQVLDASTGVLLVLSRLQAAGAIQAMGPDAVNAVETFSKTVAEAQR